MSDHAPIQITATLASAIAYHPSERVAIDSPLAYAVTLERLGHEFFGDEPGRDVIAATAREPDPALPLAVHRHDSRPELWCYCASLSEPAGETFGAERLHWHKRFDDGNAQRALESGVMELGRKTKVQINSGEFKGYRMPLYVQHVQALRWHAVGDAAEVRRLLTAHVHHLGKRRNTGHGAVLGWDVEPWAGPSDRWLWREPGHLARAVPLVMVDEWDGETAHAAYRPPYWLAAHHALCALPAEVSA